LIVLAAAAAIASTDIFFYRAKLGPGRKYR
jgi:hypothetical protein